MLITKKASLYSISILNGTNKVVGSTHDNFSNLRPGSYIRVNNEDTLYPITQTQSIFYSKPFTNNKNREIIIDDYCGILLQKGDAIKIFYDRFCLDTIVKISECGKGYTEGEIVTAKGGIPSINNMDGQVYPTRFIVNVVNPEGGIVMLSKTTNSEDGDYIEQPSGDIELTGGKGGHGAKIVCNYKTINSTLFINRTIREISYNNGKTNIILDYSIDPNISKGILSLEKWEAHLAYNYLGDNKVCVPYETFKDFTPNIGLPLLLKNSRSTELLFNQGMLSIDKEINELKQAIAELQAKIN